MNYLKIYLQLVEKALERPQGRRALKAIYGAVDRHHILPKGTGGDDDAGNMVFFTLKEHRLAHLLLAKADPKNVKFAKAAFFMSFYKDGRKMSTRLYEKLRAEYVNSITNVPKTQQHCENIRAALTGYKQTDEHRRRTSEGRTGCKVSEEANKARSERMLVEYANGKRPPMLDKHHSETTKLGLTEKLNEQYASGERVSPFADPVIWKKAQETIKRNAANGRVRKPRPPLSQEVKAELRAKKLERDKVMRLTCPKCGKEGPKSNMLQHHFDNCGIRTRGKPD